MTKTGMNNPNWKGGITMTANGRYCATRVNGKYRMDHIIKAETAIGRSLPIGAIVHHHDEIKTNNENTNLVICQDRAYHAHIHKRMRLLRCGFDPNTHTSCPTCKSVKPKEEFHKNAGSYTGLNNECKSCVLAKTAARATAKRNGRSARAYRRRVTIEAI